MLSKLRLGAVTLVMAAACVVSLVEHLKNL